MQQLRTRDVEAVLRTVSALQIDGSESWELRLLRELPSLVPAEMTAYNEMNLAGGHSFAVVNPDEGFNQALFPVLLEHMHEHPLIEPHTRTIPVVSISERVSRRDFRQLGIYHELYRVLDVEDQIAITLPSPWPILIGVTLSRCGWGFTRRERAVLSLLRPHLLHAQAAAAAMQRLAKQATQWKRTLDCLPHALIAVSREGKRLWQSDAAGPLLEAYFPATTPGGPALPEQLRRWLREQWYRFEESLAVAQPLIVDSPAGRLIVRPLCGPDGQRLLLLDERPTAAASVAQLRRLNLTPREAEVLHGIMGGGTNQQIGHQLNISARTVQKHAERLFVKLNVQTRTAAATRARELLGNRGA